MLRSSVLRKLFPVGVITALNQSRLRNYPNPFNPETVVPFALPVSGEIRVAIYNVLGQEVAVLVDGYRAAGFHRLIWNGQDAHGRPTSSGIYFVRLVADDFSSVRKMLLLK